jgi:hypothetical protein
MVCLFCVVKGANNEKFIFSLSNLPASYTGPSTVSDTNGVVIRNNNRAHTADDVIAFLESFIANTAPLLVPSFAYHSLSFTHLWYMDV